MAFEIIVCIVGSYAESIGFAEQIAMADPQIVTTLTRKRDEIEAR